MNKPSVIFFGSFLEYSVEILRQLHESEKVDLVGVMTTPARPAGRKQILTPTHVQEYAQKQGIAFFTPEILNAQTLEEMTETFGLTDTGIDLFVVAGYGKLLPGMWLEFPRIAPVNIHFSLLPDYRGAMPGEWAMFMGEKETGISLIEMAAKFDTGAVYARESLEIAPEETRESLYQKLYQLGGETFLKTIDIYLDFKAHPQTPLEINAKNLQVTMPPVPQPTESPTTYARLITKDDSFVPWRLLEIAMQGSSPEIDELTDFLGNLPSHSLTKTGWPTALERMIRALYGWPGVWTKVNTSKGEKRLKILSAYLQDNSLVLDMVQLEGEQAQSFAHIQSRLLT